MAGTPSGGNAVRCRSRPCRRPWPTGDPAHPWEALVGPSDDAPGREARISSPLSWGDVVSKVLLPPEKPPRGPTIGRAVNAPAGLLPRALRDSGTVRSPALCRACCRLLCCSWSGTRRTPGAACGSRRCHGVSLSAATPRASVLGAGFQKDERGECFQCLIIYSSCTKCQQRHRQVYAVGHVGGGRVPLHGRLAGPCSAPGVWPTPGFCSRALAAQKLPKELTWLPGPDVP